ncbi:hypothetical protein EAH80_20930 [Mycobacterium hodleri]|uniref:Uncharacterized protein n=1 Tax=Mycolicibacterium hodleri TaxID=49897 RepID=A0A502E3K5_9MYCO|nr:hypothetical protein EAH80_20930 [Mycolicibacterium hodleri]
MSVNITDARGPPGISTMLQTWQRQPPTQLAHEMGSAPCRRPVRRDGVNPGARIARGRTVGNQELMQARNA